MLPANLPNIHRAKLPAIYERAKTELETCARIDECQEWADKAAALASYAKQAEDDSLLTLAGRVKARAIRRCGELLKAIQPAKGGDRGNAATGGRTPVGETRTVVAKQAGLSADQRKTALRVANVPKEEFEAAVESEAPPTITELAERGKQRKPVPVLDIGDRDPSDVKAATRGQGALRFLVDAAAEVTPFAVARGTLPKEYDKVLGHIEAALEWVTALRKALQLEQQQARRQS